MPFPNAGKGQMTCYVPGSCLEVAVSLLDGYYLVIFQDGYGRLNPGIQTRNLRIDFFRRVFRNANCGIGKVCFGSQRRTIDRPGPEKATLWEFFSA